MELIEFICNKASRSKDFRANHAKEFTANKA